MSAMTAKKNPDAAVIEADGVNSHVTEGADGIPEIHDGPAPEPEQATIVDPEGIERTGSLVVDPPETEDTFAQKVAATPAPVDHLIKQLDRIKKITYEDGMHLFALIEEKMDRRPAAS